MTCPCCGLPRHLKNARCQLCAPTMTTEKDKLRAALRDASVALRRLHDALAPGADRWKVADAMGIVDHLSDRHD